MIKKIFKDFFTFEKRGQKGLLILSIILMSQLIILWALNFYHPFKVEKPALTLVDPKLLDSLEKQTQNPYNENKKNEAFNDDVVTFHSYKKEAQRFKFNPNKINAKQWQSLGLSIKQSEIILKYISKGGKFKKAEDVLKIWAVNKQTWEELIPYIVLDENLPPNQPLISPNKDTSAEEIQVKKAKEKAERFEAFKQTLLFEFNTCSKWNLKQLDLLDSLTIEKVFKYKTALGGFTSLAQLYEIEGVDTSNFNKLKRHLTLDVNSVKTININTCSVSQLNKHPYLSYNVALALVNYRNAHGKYAQINDLKKCMAMNDKLLKKITPYLRLNDE
jgi:DNA uptake protein ComE-like DNA-binding protein